MGADLTNRLFVRLGAKERRFTKVQFMYCIFQECYLRKCTFDSCDFTGCRFIATNLYGSHFSGCTFDYATFERTIVDIELLTTGCPRTENLTMRFARSLRTNFQQLGDWRSANAAIRIELEATGIHLLKAWRSKESYYRHKYKGLQRLRVFAEWLGFKILDLIWGNGESAWKLLRAVACFWLAMCVAAILFGDVDKLGIVPALARVFPVFFGALSPENYPAWYLTVVVVVRLIAFGFFMSIVIKRFNRR
jgi:hypothetical protein